MSRCILLMLSGGVDSTYLLYRFLRDTPHRIHAHHISLRYPHQERWRAEDPACARIVEWCRTNCRDFEYSTSRFDLDFHRIGWDSDLQLLVASKVALNLGTEPIELVLGWCADDLERPPVRERRERGVTPALWKALISSTGRENLSDEIRMPLVEEGLTKTEVMEALPAELFELTWSCRNPAYEDDGHLVLMDRFQPCGICHACRSREAAR